MDISQIGALTSSTLLSNGKTVSTNDNSLSTNDFYKLLAAEMQYQDPTSSDSGSSSSSSDGYIQEMIQYSSVEAIQNLAKVTNYSVASSLTGKNVSYNKTYVDDNNQYTTEKITGTVEAVDFSSDTPKCYVTQTADGKTTGEWVNYNEIQQVYASDVTGISGTSSSTTTA